MSHQRCPAVSTVVLTHLNPAFGDIDITVQVRAGYEETVVTAENLMKIDLVSD